MTCDREHYYAVQTFLEDDELHKIWNIIEIAMNREGYDVEGKDYGSKVDALVDSMGVTENKVSTSHRRRDLDTL